MNTNQLPNAFIKDKLQAVSVHLYQNAEGISKQQVVLNQHAFSFLRAGKKEVYFDNSAQLISNDSFLIMKSGHCLMTEKLPVSAKNYESVLLFFSNDFLARFLSEQKLNTNHRVNTHSVSAVCYDEYINLFVEGLMQLDRSNLAHKRALLENKCAEILLYLIEKIGAHFFQGLLNDTADEVLRFKQTIETNKLNKLRLKELAFLCNMSISTFKRTFEKHYGESPVKWFINKRLDHAHHLIHHEQRRPSDVYFEVGYENLSSFIQAYKLKFGKTPKQDIDR